MKVTAADLLQFEPEAPITEKGLRLNINVAIQYIGAWLVGPGRGADLQPDGRRGDRRDLALAGLAVDPLVQGQARRRPQGHEGDGRGDDSRGECRRSASCSAPPTAAGKYDDAAEIFADLVDNDTFVEFLTLPAYERID